MNVEQMNIIVRVGWSFVLLKTLILESFCFIIFHYHIMNLVDLKKIEKITILTNGRPNEIMS